MMNSPIFNVHQFPEWADTISNEIETAKKLDPDWHYANNWRVDKNGLEQQIRLIQQRVYLTMLDYILLIEILTFYMKKVQYS